MDIFGTVTKCPSQRDTRFTESTRGSKKREGPTLGARFSKVSFLTEVSVKRELTIIVKKTDMFPSRKQLQPYYITQQTMTYTYLCDENILLNLQYQQTGQSSDSLRDFSQSIISQQTTLYKKKIYQSKAFDSTNEGWLILIVNQQFQLESLSEKLRLVLLWHSLGVFKNFHVHIYLQTPCY